MNTLSKSNSIILTWIPSHIDIRENEKVDKLQKSTLGRHIQYKNSIHWPKINHSYLRNGENLGIIKHRINSHRWVGADYRRNRKEVILSWLHISHSHLLKREDIPICSTCKVPLTVKYILIHCDRFRQIYPKYYLTSNLKDLFKNTKPKEILTFLKETNLFIKN